MICNTVWQFSIKINTWWWPARAETCCEESRKENIQVSFLGCTVTDVVLLYVK
jgi:hypothetical protein